MRPSQTESRHELMNWVFEWRPNDEITRNITTSSSSTPKWQWFASWLLIRPLRRRATWSTPASIRQIAIGGRENFLSIFLSLSLHPIRFSMDNSITSIDKEQVLSQRCTSNLVKYSHQAFLFSSVQLKMNFGQIIPLLSYIDSYPVFPFSYILYLELRASNWKRSIGSSYADYF